ncbi:hypothetical protein [Lentzea sp. NBRC 102530]|nr:hypothetical protein [Lentzea sp. NBRC 102530]
MVRPHECGQALEFAATINPRAVATLPAERQVTYLIGVTKARAGR